MVAVMVDVQVIEFWIYVGSLRLFVALKRNPYELVTHIDHIGRAQNWWEILLENQMHMLCFIRFVWVCEFGEMFQWGFVQRFDVRMLQILAK